jgi:hypothetical protein
VKSIPAIFTEFAEFHGQKTVMFGYLIPNPSAERIEQAKRSLVARRVQIIDKFQSINSSVPVCYAYNWLPTVTWQHDRSAKVSERGCVISFHDLTDDEVAKAHSLEFGDVDELPAPVIDGPGGQYPTLEAAA